jgi:PAS domain S-box-containing protein
MSASSARLEAMRSFLAGASSAGGSEPFFRALARQLAQTLDMFYVCIDRLEGDGLTARTVAIWCDGHFSDDLSYALKDTPCGDVVGKNICWFPHGVSALFPRDPALQELKAESYIGTTLWSHTGQAIGLIAVIGREPLKNRSSAESILKLVAVRAAGELERQMAEESLHQRERRFEDIARASADWIWEVDAKGRYSFVSEGVTDLLGYTPLEIVGKTPFDLMPPEEAARVGAEFAASAERRETFRDLDNIVLHKDGSRRHVQTNGVPIIDAGGEWLGYRGLDRDITEQFRLHEALSDSEELFRSLTAITPAGIYVTDAKGGCIYANARWCEMAGMTMQDALGSGWLKGVHPEDRDQVAARWTQTIQAAGSWGLEYRFQTPDGKVTWVYGLATPQKDRAGKVTKYVGINWDITDRRKADEKLKLQAAVLDQIQDSVVVTDLEGHITYENARANSIHSQPMGRVGLHVSTWGDAPEADATQQEIVEATRANGSWKGTVVNLRADGSSMFVDLRTALVKDVSGKPYALVGVGTDATERKRIEQDREQRRQELEELVQMRTAELHAAEVKYRTVADFTYDWETWTDSEGRWLYCSPQLRTDHRLSRRGILGATGPPPRDRPRGRPRRRRRSPAGWTRPRYVRHRVPHPPQERRGALDRAPLPARPGCVAAPTRPARLQPRHHRTQGRRCPAAQGSRRCGSREPGQEYFPRQHEPRDPHADERHRRADPHPAPRLTAAGTGRQAGQDRQRGGPPAGGDQRHPRRVENRGRQAGAGESRLRTRSPAQPDFARC